jgi:hypothetical protein
MQSLGVEQIEEEVIAGVLIHERWLMCSDW